MQFCCERKSDPFEPSPILVVEFLDLLFRKGLGYNSLNTARSAISSLSFTNVNTVGNNPLVCRFMRGVFTRRPSLPRYSSTWDVSLVLNYLKTLVPVNSISFKHLTWKLVMLLTLLTGQRGQTLHLMDLQFIKLTQNSINIQLMELLKTSKPGKHLAPLLLYEFETDKRLCVVETMIEYIKRTKILRGKESKLFITTIKPYKPISRQTLSSWVQKIMILSGIDIKKFAPHSTRSASVSTATKCGVPLDLIMKSANWSNEQTFYKFYFKSIDKENSFNRILDKGI